MNTPQKQKKKWFLLHFINLLFIPLYLLLILITKFILVISLKINFIYSLMNNKIYRSSKNKKQFINTYHLNEVPLPYYNPLSDPYLSGYFSNWKVHSHITRQGLLY